MSGIERIAAERQRQIAQEGFGIDHDDDHGTGELAQAAAVYVVCSYDWGEDSVPFLDWPWDPKWLKPRGTIRNLEKAGALIAAEIDRLERIGG